MEPQSQAVEAQDERKWELRDEELDRAGLVRASAASALCSRWPGQK